MESAEQDTSLVTDIGHGFFIGIAFIVGVPIVLLFGIAVLVIAVVVIGALAVGMTALGLKPPRVAFHTTQTGKTSLRLTQRVGRASVSRSFKIGD